MLKIKDNVDLRTLRKYDFRLKYIHIMNDREIWFELKDNDYIRKKQYETLYDLIKADLVEKVDVSEAVELAEKENTTIYYSVASGESNYDDLYFFLINNMSFNYVWNLYRMIKEKIEDVQGSKDK